MLSTKSNCLPLFLIIQQYLSIFIHFPAQITSHHIVSVFPKSRPRPITVCIMHTNYIYFYIISPWRRPRSQWPATSRSICQRVCAYPSDTQILTTEKEKTTKQKRGIQLKCKTKRWRWVFVCFCCCCCCCHSATNLHLLENFTLCKQPPSVAAAAASSTRGQVSVTLQTI